MLQHERRNWNNKKVVINRRQRNFTATHNCDNQCGSLSTHTRTHTHMCTHTHTHTHTLWSGLEQTCSQTEEISSCRFTFSSSLSLLLLDMMVLITHNAVWLAVCVCVCVCVSFWSVVLQNQQLMTEKLLVNSRPPLQSLLVILLLFLFFIFFNLFSVASSFPPLLVFPFSRIHFPSFLFISILDPSFFNLSSCFVSQHFSSALLVFRSWSSSSLFLLSLLSIPTSLPLPLLFPPSSNSLRSETFISPFIRTHLHSLISWMFSWIFSSLLIGGERWATGVRIFSVHVLLISDFPQERVCVCVCVCLCVCVCVCV